MKKKVVFILIFLFLTAIPFNLSLEKVYADELTTSIEDQLKNLDLQDLEDLFSSTNTNGLSFIDTLYSMLKGEYNLSFTNFFSYLLKTLLASVYNLLPTILIIIALSILSAIINSAKSKMLGESVSKIINFVFLISTILLLSNEFIDIISTTKNIINFQAKLNEIMSPIILTLMVASGGSVSASIYKPAVVFLSVSTTDIILSLIIPLVILATVFGVFNTVCNQVKLGKLTECVQSFIKWIIGLLAAIFGLFITIQGIASSFHDGISVRATKYALSNSIPIVGSMVKDGFDLVVASSILIKNTIGVASISALIYVILSPILYMIAFSLLLKLVSGITETIGDNKISEICVVASKTLTYLISIVLIAGLMLFICVLLMIFSANAFI